MTVTSEDVFLQPELIRHYDGPIRPILGAWSHVVAEDLPMWDWTMHVTAMVLAHRLGGTWYEA